MDWAARRGASWSFDEFEFFWTGLELTSSCARTRLKRQPAQVLAVLLERAGQLVTRDDLRLAVWGEDVFVDFDDALNHCVKYLRDALGDNPSSPRFIETIPKRGYRFIAPVVERRRPAASPAAPEPQSALPSRRVTVVAVCFLALVMGAVLLLRLSSTPAPLGRTPIRSIAVLPLQSLSGDSSQDYFAEGITDDLTTELAQIGSVQVISRTSAVHYKNSRLTLPEIGRALKVDGIVEGSVRRSGNRVRITAQLIDARDDRNVWAGSYEDDLGNVLFAQRQIASAIATQISVQLTTQQKQQLTQRRPVNAEAYDAFLQGRYYWNERSGRTTLDKAASYFERAIALDPDYADAYAALADIYFVLPFLSHASQNQTYPRAKAAAERALQLDPNSAEAHLAKAYSLLYCDWNFAAAEQEFRRAIELNANFAMAHQWYAEMLSLEGRDQEALTQMQQVLRLDPASAVVYHQLGITLKNAGHYEAAVQAYQHALQLDPSLEQAAAQMARAYGYLGDYSEWAQSWRLAAAIQGQPDFSASIESLIRSSQPGHIDEQGMLHDAIARTPRPAFYEAAIYVEEGDKVHAFQELQEALRHHDSEILSLKVAPEFASLHNDARFASLLRQIGLPQ